MIYKKSKVVFFDMRRFFPEEIHKNIETRDIETAKKNCPIEACCFKFYDLQYEQATTESGEVLEVNHKNVNFSPTYYMPPNERFTLEDIAKLALTNPSKYKIALSNMRCNGFKQAVRTRSGNLCPLYEEDILF